MIDGSYYHGIYLFIVTICTLVAFNKYNHSSKHVYEKSLPALILALLLSIFIGLRPNHNVFADTVGYISFFQMNVGSPFEFSTSVENLIFDNLLLFLASYSFSWSFFFVIIALLYFVCRYASCKKMFPNNTLSAYLVFLGAFITFAYAVNGIKAGVAASLFCCAIAYKDKLWLAALFLALSFGFHHSMHVCIAAFIVVYFYKNTKVYSYFWVACLFMAVANVSYFQNFFAGLTDEKGASYLLGDSYITGMRYDFVLYSVMPIMMGWYITFKKKVVMPEYQFILNLYLLLNGLWLLCFNASFTNRIAALSWFLYPIVLTYPFLTSMEIAGVNKYKLFAKVILLHLGFTLFMNIVYY